MRNYLLQLPERAIIETFLRNSSEAETPLSFEYLIGFLTGAVLTPGLRPTDWLPEITGRIKFETLESAQTFVSSVMPLFQRLAEQRLNNEVLCPFDKGPDLAEEDNFTLAMEWASGLNAALLLRSEVWIGEKYAAQVPPELALEVTQTIPLIWAIAVPQDIPEIVPDPLNFQKNLLSQADSWQEEEIREIWDDELIELFQFFCLGRLSQSVETLQRFSLAFGSAPGDAAAPAAPKIGRNDPCPCGSGKKYKKCCGA